MLISPLFSLLNSFFLGLRHLLTQRIIIFATKIDKDMSKQVEQMRRMLLILNNIKQRQRISKQELLSRVNDRLYWIYGYKEVGVRTLERDLEDIESMFCVNISYDRSNNYYIIDRQSRDYDTKMAELLMNFDLLNSLGSENNLSSFVVAEHHRPQHSEWLPSLISAIKNTHPVTFTYIDYRRDNSTFPHRVEPHYLKESNQRWYLLGYEDGILKNFGVDRIRNLEILSDETFKRSMNIDVDELFRDCYGIWNDPRMPIEDIVLRFSPLDGRFIKSLPIHHSQNIIVDDEKEFRISLRLRITNDFVMELLSRSKSLEVLEPQHLRDEIREIYENAIKRNS